MRRVPFIFPIPSDGRSLMQPLWVEDHVPCLVWALENPDMVNSTYEVGGAEYFTLRQVLQTLMNVTNRRRMLLPLPFPWMRALIVLLDSINPRLNVSTYWLDYVSVNRTCPVDNLPRNFGLMPARFGYRLDYLVRKPWYSSLMERFQKFFRTMR
jgi:NADH dehydrogenase